MQFLAPSLLLGLLAAALPWLIHRIGRRRARPLRFAAMELLVRAERQVSARRRLREILLLVVRTSAAAALPLLFARPFTEVRSDLPAAAQRPQTAVIVIDDSASLQRRADGPAGTLLFDAARTRARSLLESMAPETDVALVLASEGAAAPVPEPSTDRQRIRAALDALTASSRRGELAPALARAAQIAGGGSHRERRIYLITDLQASGFPEGGSVAPSGVPVTLLPVGADEPWDNRAVVDLTVEPAPEAGGQGVSVVAEIANFSAQRLDHFAVSLRVDDAEVARGFVDLPAGGRTKKRFLHVFSGATAAHEAVVQIAPDRFPLDDRRLARIDVSRGLRVLVVSGDPRTVRTEDEGFFLEAALRSGGNRFQVRTALADDLGTQRLEDYAAVFLINVARPDSTAATALIRYVEGGGGLFVSVGDRVDAEAWNQRLRPILPQPLGLSRTAATRPGAVEGETIDDRPAERLAPIDRRHPLLASFTAGGEGLTSARFFRYLLLEPVPEKTGRSVILRYETGAPALVEAEIGRGRVLLLTTTVDRDWTDLPIRPGFLPLVQEAARRLAGAPPSDAVSALVIGTAREIPAQPDDSRIEITKPGGDVRALVPRATDNGGEAGRPTRAVVFSETDRLGTYQVRAFRDGGTWVDRPTQAFVVNLDTRESDPALLPADRRPDQPGAGATADASAPKRRMELWHLLGAALIALLLAESALTLTIRRDAIRQRSDKLTV